MGSPSLWLFDGYVYGACEFAIFAASREMVVHVAQYFLHEYMYLGAPMLYTVVFRQFAQIEDVANLVFWMVRILVLGMRLGGRREHGLIARLAGQLMVVLLLGW